jgi:uncharacterized DUF497 family protein
MDFGRDGERVDLRDFEFEWHPLKAAANLKKHGVSLEEARTIFGDKRVLVVPDRGHSFDEVRSLAIGRSENGRLLTMSFTDRGERIRVISTRIAERWERREYEGANEPKRTRNSEQV